jgi:hypothetical protein
MKKKTKKKKKTQQQNIPTKQFKTKEQNPNIHKKKGEKE